MIWAVMLNVPAGNLSASGDGSNDIAPEVLAAWQAGMTPAQASTAAGDIWSAGSLLYFMATGHKPFSAKGSSRQAPALSSSSFSAGKEEEEALIPAILRSPARSIPSREEEDMLHVAAGRALACSSGEAADEEEQRRLHECLLKSVSPALAAYICALLHPDPAQRPSARAALASLDLLSMQPDVDPSMLQPKRPCVTASGEMSVTSGEWHQAQTQSNADSSSADRLQLSSDVQGVSNGQNFSKSATDLQSRIDGISVPPAVQLPPDYVSGLQQRIQGISIPPELDADLASHSGSRHAAGGKPDVSSGGKISLHAESQASCAVDGLRGLNGGVKVKAHQPAASSSDAQVGFAHQSFALVNHMSWFAPVVLKLQAAPCLVSDCWMLYTTDIDIITNADCFNGVCIQRHSAERC